MPDILDRLEKQPRNNADFPPAPRSLFLHHHRHPLKWLHSTHLHLTDREGRTYEWQSRKERKGRYLTKHHRIHHDGRETFVHIRIPHDGGRITPNLNGDISFWVAVTFVFGSVIWVVNGFLSFLPYLYPWVGRNAIAKTNSAIGFVGGVVFVGGSQLMITEALTCGREMDIKTALGRLLRNHGIDQNDGTVSTATAPPPPPGTATSATNRNLATTDPATAPGATARDSTSTDPATRDSSSSSDSGELSMDSRHGLIDDEGQPRKEHIVWIGKPLWHDMGFMIAFWQLLAAIIFWVATLTGLHNVIPGMGEGRHHTVAEVLNWTPQVVGSVGFCISSTLQIIEVQRVWWKPEIFELGFWAGVWNLIGSIGFLLCGAFGYSLNHGMDYQSSLSTFWGSWAFLIASSIMLWEVVFREKPEEPHVVPGVRNA